MNKAIGYVETIKLLFNKPQDFFKTIKEIDLFKIPFSYFLIIGLIISYTLQKTEKIINLYLEYGNIFLIILVVLLYSLLAFVIHVSFYNFRVKICGGKPETKQSQKLVLFSNFFLYIIISVYFLYFLLLILNDFNISDKVIDLIDNTYVIIYLVFALHAIYLSYNGVKALYPDLKEGKAKFCFIYLPGFFTIISSLYILFFT